MQVSDRIKEIRTVRASEILPNPKNWRTHPEEQKNAMMGVFAEIGNIDVLKCVETEKGLMLIDGHLRTDILGDNEIKVAILDLTVDEANKALATFDPIAMSAKADEEKLASLLSEIEFESNAIDDMLEGLDLTAGFGGGVKGLTDPDEVPEVPEEPVVKPGELWLLGDHRLLCGDSTKAEDVERLMGGERAGMIHTDPPYGMSYQSNMRTKTAKFTVLENDDKILTDWIPEAIDTSDGWVFIWTTWKVLEQWFPVVKPFGKLSNMVVWSKGGGGIGDLKKTFSTDHEIAFVFNRGAELCGKRIGSVWSFGKDSAGDYKHPTQKPVALAAEAIDKTTRVGCLVYDPFLGSGTTLIAAEQLNRKCYGMEISPQYCDVIIKRWEDFTGNKAELAE